MNSIAFRCTKNAQEGLLPTVDVEIIIDGKAPLGGVVDVSGAIFGSAVERSSFYVFTCSCGHAGCNGYHQPLDHRREDGRVMWDIEDEKLAEDFGASELCFDEAQFDAAVAEFRAQIEAFEAQGVFATDMQDIDFTEDDKEVHYGIKLADTAKHAVPYYQGQTKMAKLRAEASAPGDDNNIRFSWGGAAMVPSEKRFSLWLPVDIAACLLRLGVSLRPEEVAAAAELSAAAQLIRDFATSGDAKAANAAFEPLRRFLREDEMDEDGAVIFGLDEIGPFVRHP